MFNRMSDQSKIMNIVLRKLGYINQTDPVLLKLASNYGEVRLDDSISRIFFDSEIDAIKDVFMSDFSPNEEKQARYLSLADDLLKAFSIGEAENCKKEMRSIRKELQKNTKMVLEQNKELLKEENAFTFFERAKYGIEKHTELDFAKYLLSKTQRGSDLNKFLAQEVVSLTNQPMATDPNYKKLLNKLQDARDPKEIKYHMQEAVALRQKGQLAATVYLNSKDSEFKNISALHNR